MGGGAAGVTDEARSNKLAAVVGAACGGGAEGAGESKRLRMSSAVFFCGLEAESGELVDVSFVPPKISARRSSFVLLPPGTATAGSEGADISSPRRSTLKEETAVQERRKSPGDEISYAHLSLSWLTQQACSRLLDGERITLKVDVRQTSDVPTPVTVAFNSGGGIRSRTPTRSSPSEKRLANSTARCWSSNSRFVVYPARTLAMRSC